MCRVGTHVPEPTSVCRVLRGFRAHRQRELVFYISAIANRPPRQKRVWRTLGKKQSTNRIDLKTLLEQLQ